MEIPATRRWSQDDAPTEEHRLESSSTGPVAAGDDPLVGSLVADRYLLTSSLGHGATADVYRGHDQQLERDVAVKLLRAELSGHPEASARFHDESLVAARVHHPHVAAVYDAGIHAGRPFIVMECLSGGTLADRLAHMPLAVDDVRPIALQLLGALQAAHELGVVHRDVKPSNVLLSEGGTAKLADFGIAKHDALADRTEVGVVVGTPSYMAPERFRGAPATPQSDMYGLAMVVRDALLGRRPASAAAVCTPDDLVELSGMDQTLAHVVATATQPEPQARFASAAAMHQALSDARGQDTSPVQAEPAPTQRLRTAHRTSTTNTRARVAAAIVVVLMLVVGGAWATYAFTSTGDTGVQQTPTTLPVPDPLRGPIDDLRAAVGS